MNPVLDKNSITDGGSTATLKEYQGTKKDIKQQKKKSAAKKEIKLQKQDIKLQKRRYYAKIGPQAAKKHIKLQKGYQAARKRY